MVSFEEVSIVRHNRGWWRSGGSVAALRASELGAKVALVERAHRGGTCTNDGCVPTRVLARAARLAAKTEHFGDYGLMGERPTVDFRGLLQRTHQLVYKIHETNQLISHLEQANVSVYANHGSVQFTDAHTAPLMAGGRIL